MNLPPGVTDFDIEYQQDPAEYDKRQAEYAAAVARRMNSELCYCARDAARHNLTGEVGDLLPDYIGSDTCEWINEHVDLFRELVNLYADHPYAKC